MRKKKIWAVLVACILMLLTISAPVLAASNKPPTDHTQEYAKWGITVQGTTIKTFYHNGTRIRIFQDMKQDNSFENSAVDINGTIDIRLLRDKKGVIKSLEYIPESEANEILEDLLGYIPSTNIKDTNSNMVENAIETKGNEYTNIKRYELEDVPENIQNTIITKCTGSDWYLIKDKDKQYIYQSNMPRDYAYQIVGNNLNVRDIGSRKNIYVLLALGSDFNFTFTYNSASTPLTNIVMP